MAAAVPTAPPRLFLLQATPSPNPSSTAAAAAQAQALRLSLPRRMAGRALAVIAGASGDSERDISASAVSLEALDSVVSDSDLEAKKEPSVATMLTSFENSFDKYGAVSTPLYQTATFKQPSATDYESYDYTRSGNPTRDVLQSLMAKLEKADQAFCFTSGMAALAAVTHLLKAGQEIVAGEDIYGGSDRLLSQVVPRNGIVVKRVDTTKISDVVSAIGPSTRLVWLESPTNPRQQITDIKTISEIAHSHGALVLVDNSIMSPVLSHPIELGAGSTLPEPEQEPEANAEQQIPELQQAEEVDPASDTNLPECPSHEASVFTQDGQVYFGYCKHCLYPVEGDEE